ncbi:E3 ubiquitin-protein ligase MARCH3-like [Diaphorina citri]|uniref:E3 ubiquitin-protein ligase MARCH3-like n=1 Tax=Diaphorina citri TaxID=121845 RepID=A0A1S3DNM3_DIACI|nr:E3 ubiquitin-protein ligase MARCH3-like [Diaphorina citri]KAI5705614.1 hypothetical protein M8J75_000245 [Diaphorina citri]KAI5740969.1 hypothetical protein M8J76_009106 [Diaphorina citri]KAI5748388.1 hypothetical protein M8J77_024963 [Diaphorina citri]
MDSVLQIFAVLTKQSTNFLYRKAQQNVCPSNVEENASDGAFEPAGAASTSDRNTASDDRVDDIDRQSGEKPVSNLESQRAEMRTNDDLSVTSFNSMGTKIFDKLMIQLDKPDSSDDEDMTICRICYGADQQNLLSICQCKGSIAYVHIECIERWLQECGVDKCDLCKYQFTTERLPTQTKLKSLLSWVKHVDNREDMEEMLTDFAATFLFSPFIILLTLSGYQTFSNNAIRIFVPMNNQLTFSLSGTLSTLSLITILSLVNSIGFSWLCYIFHKHYSRWYSWYRRSTIVKIVLPGDVRKETGVEDRQPNERD